MMKYLKRFAESSTFPFFFLAIFTFHIISNDLDNKKYRRYFHLGRMKKGVRTFLFQFLAALVPVILIFDRHFYNQLSLLVPVALLVNFSR